MINRRCIQYVFIIVVIRYKTTAAAGWTLMFIVRAFINYTITATVWARFSFHVCLMRPADTRITRQPDQSASNHQTPAAARPRRPLTSIPVPD
jgi:hypothetical protein